MGVLLESILVKKPIVPSAITGHPNALETQGQPENTMMALQ
jgi:hypothetical protein